MLSRSAGGGGFISGRGELERSTRIHDGAVKIQKSELFD